jgi:site-specific recombinase XerD
MLAENGANIVELRDLLRHSDVRVSERYLHSNNERLRQVANKLGNHLDKIAITGN